MKKYNVAIVGIRGAVGQEILSILKERNFPVEKLRLFSTSLEEDEKEVDGYVYEKLTEANAAEKFKDVQIGLFSPGASVSKIFAPIAAEAGCVVIDNTSAFRMDPEVPLVVPEVNPEDIKKNKGIIANPNCSTIQMVVALKPLHDFGKIKRVIVSSYQSVSGAGSSAIVELQRQQQGSKEVSAFQHQINNNLIPHIDVPQPNFYTKEEMKMVNETKKIMGDESIKVTATCVRVPVYRAHSESVNVETEKKISREKAIELLENASGIEVVDNLHENAYPLPLDAEGKDETFVGRIREDETIENGINLWVVSDNLRKGAALNAVQIAEELIRGMKNYKLTLEYDGTNFKGFQIQKTGSTIQSEVEKALRKLFHKKIRIISCGRTDTGVHAVCHVVNFKVETKIRLESIQKALNRYLPREIVVKKIAHAPLEFHAQYDAKSKIYEYSILHSDLRSPTKERYAYRFSYALEIPKMKKALALLKGTHDFRSFASKTDKKKNTVRTMHQVKLLKKGSFLVIRLEANGFLYNMVRNIVGTLLLVGTGKMTLEEFRKVLAKKDRKLSGPVAPPQGLLLKQVKY